MAWDPTYTTELICWFHIKCLNVWIYSYFNQANKNEVVTGFILVYMMLCCLQKTKNKKTTKTLPSSIFLAAETLYMALRMSQNVLTWAQLRDVIAVGIRKSLRHWDTYIKQPENCCGYDTFAGQCCSLWYWHSMLLWITKSNLLCWQVTIKKTKDFVVFSHCLQ